MTTVADGLGSRTAGEWTLALVQRYVDEVLAVSDPHLLRAVTTLLGEERIVAEPAGSAGLAGILQHGTGKFGSNICILITGANIADKVACCLPGTMLLLLIPLVLLSGVCGSHCGAGSEGVK